MFEDKELPAQMLANPGQIQRLILGDLEDRTNGTVVASDPNNAVLFVLDANASIAAQFARQEERVFSEIYPRRATTAESLYRHMSDFDYLDVMASPALTSVTLAFDRNELMARAVSYTGDYKKLVIPANTVFNIGARTYGIYYPIEIRINVNTENFLVTYDTSSENPLHELASNTVEFTTYRMQGIDFLNMTIPVFQFSRSTYEESVVNEQGFNVSYGFSDQFMAARVFTYKDGAWKELAYTLSEDVYDREIATAKLKLLPEESRVIISIPQVYINTGAIGTKVRVEIYSTEGELDVPITEAEASSMRVSFNSRAADASAYTAPLSALTLLIALPASTRVIGGKSTISLEELRNRVIYGSFAAGVPVTPSDLKSYIEDKGFTPTKYLDNVTNRTYYANKKLLLPDGTPAPVTTASIKLSNTVIDATQTVIEFADNTVTILPTTVYEYVPSALQCVPLTDAEATALSQLSDTDLVDLLNSTIHTRQPFHLVIYTDDKYPKTKTFNLNSPSVEHIVFVSENVQSVAQLLTLTSDVIHNGSGTGGFTIRLGIQKSEDLADVDESDIYIVLTTTDRAGRLVYLRATYSVSTDTIDMYTADLDTDYHISEDGYIRTTMYISEGVTTDAEIPLSAAFQVRMMVTDSIVPEQSQTTLGSGIPAEYTGVAELVRQRLTVTLGTDMSNEVFNITTAIWAAEEYQTWPEDVYVTYETDVYQREPDGTLSYTIDGGSNVVLTKLHSVGDQVLDEFDQPIIKHAAGDIKRDGAGNPIVLQNREVTYYIDALMLDARFYESEGADEIAYVSQFPTEFMAYAAIVSEMNSHLLEATDLFLRPIHTIGTAQFSRGNGELIDLDLGLGFTVSYYVTRAVMSSDDIKSVIEATTLSIIESHVSKSVISVTAISKDLQTALAANIVSVDAVGINGSTVQTIIPKSPNVSPIVAQKLVIQADGSKTLEKDVSVEFLLAE